LCVPPRVRWMDGSWTVTKIDDDEGIEEGKEEHDSKRYLLLYLGVIRTSVKEESDTGE
jgi:hypothetical protein